MRRTVSRRNRLTEQAAKEAHPAASSASSIDVAPKVTRNTGRPCTPARGSGIGRGKAVDYGPAAARTDGSIAAVRASRSVWIAAVVLALAASARGQIAAIEGIYDSSAIRFDLTLASSGPLNARWAFQLFIDSDDNRQTGYGHGFEKLVRGVRHGDVPYPAYGFFILRHTEGGGSLGGWGAAITTVPFTLSGSPLHLRFEIPIGPVAGLTDGSFRFAVESYMDGCLQGSVYDQYTISRQNAGRTLCDDGRFCNGAEAFMGGACAPGMAPCPGLVCDENEDACHVSFDADQNPGVDLGDFRLLADCMDGPGVPPVETAFLGSADCLVAFDSDFDEDLDLLDYAKFHRLFVPSGAPQPGDLDGDGDVDLDDYAGLANCLAGPGVTPTPAPPTRVEDCLAVFDYDADTDVDLCDFAAIQPAFAW